MSLDISLNWSFIKQKTQDDKYNTRVYEANITHNLGIMAKAVLCFGIENNQENKVISLYDILWHGSGQSSKVIAPMLEVGLKELKENREMYEFYNPENGWGSHEGLIKFTQELLEACKEFPETTLHCYR